MHNIIEKFKSFPDYSPIKIYLAIISNCKLNNKDVISSAKVISLIKKHKYSFPNLYASFTNSYNTIEELSVEKIENSLQMLQSLNFIDLLFVQEKTYAIKILINEEIANEFLNSINSNLKNEVVSLTECISSNLKKVDFTNELF